MTDRYFYKSFTIMTLTISLQNIIVYGVNLADSVMMGAYSETALSGVGICNNIQYFLMMAVVGVTNGMTVIASRYWGMQDIRAIKKVSSAANLLGLFFAVIIFGFCAISPETAIRIFTDKAAVADEAVKYLEIIKWTYLLYALTQIILAVLRSAETVTIGFYVSLSSFGINIILNYILIYGKLGMPELGIRGAAYATLISRAIELTVVLIYITLFDKKLKLRLHQIFVPDKNAFMVYVKKGLPLTSSSISWGFAMSVQGAIIGRLAESAIAANSIATTLFQIASVIVYAAASASCVLIGKTIGEGAGLDVIKKRSKGLELSYILIGVVSSVLLLGIKAAIIRFYDATPETIACTDKFTYILCFTIIGTSYECSVLTGIVSGGGDTSFVFKNDLFWMWCIVLPLSALSAFYFRWPVAVTFACLKADQVLKCPVAFLKLRSWNWIKKLENKENTAA